MLFKAFVLEVGLKRNMTYYYYLDSNTAVLLAL